MTKPCGGIELACTALVESARVGSGGEGLGDALPKESNLVSMGMAGEGQIDVELLRGIKASRSMT